MNKRNIASRRYIGNILKRPACFTSWYVEYLIN